MVILEDIQEMEQESSTSTYLLVVVGSVVSGMAAVLQKNVPP